MSDFDQNNRFSRGGGRRYGGRDSARPMHSATCAKCGNKCEVPFRPSGERPVYCSNCFERRSNEDGNSRESDRRSDRGPRFEERRSSPSVDNTGSAGAQMSRQIVEQLKSLNIKLDKIINNLESKAAEPQILETKAKKPKASRKKATEEKVKE